MDDPYPLRDNTGGASPPTLRGEVNDQSRRTKQGRRGSRIGIDKHFNARRASNGGPDAAHEV
jgi:hypothetical protein